MRKKLFLLLLGAITGILLFCKLENFNIYIFICTFVLAMIFYKKSISYFLCSLSLFILIASINFNSFSLINYDKAKLDLTIEDIKEKDDYNTYFVRAYNEKLQIHEKSTFTSNHKFEIGDKIRVEADISLPNKNTNPYLFNYRNYLLSKDIKIFLKFDKYQKLKKSNLLLLIFRNKFRKYINNIFDQNLSRKSSDFVKSIILSQKYIDISDFSSLGISHILAVSGLHIDLIMGFIIIILINMGISYKYASPIALIFCVFYGSLIGFPFSIIRVLLMNFFIYLAFILKKAKDNYKNIMLALLLIILIRPFAIFSQGLILSFLASFAIYVIYPRFRRNRSYIKNTLIFISIIQVVMFPFVAHYYNLFNIMTILANFLILPIFQVAMYLIFLIVISYPLLKSFLGLFFLILEFLVKSIIYIMRFLNHFNIFEINFPKESIFISFYILLLIFIFFGVRLTNKNKLKRFLLVSIFLVCFSIIKEINKPISFSMIDIGQGDCFILEDRGDIYLFDVGEIAYDNYSSTDSILIPFLKAKAVKNIKAIFISHDDKDHDGALEKLDRYFNIENIYTNEYNKRIIKKFNSKILKENDRLSKNDIIIDVLKNFDGKENDKSMPLLINIKETKILTMGDLPKDKEILVAKRADILKVSHHGSNSSTSKIVVDKIKPKVALISAGRNNMYRHPRDEVLNNLKNVKIYNTQSDGFVKIEFYKDGYKIDKFLKGGFFR